jgi:hypothetical protein
MHLKHSHHNCGEGIEFQWLEQPNSRFTKAEENEIGAASGGMGYGKKANLVMPAR